MDSAKIRIGNQSTFSSPVITRPFEYAVANGFDAFEWFPDKKESGAGWDIDDIDANTRSYIKNTARYFGMEMSVHSPLHINPLNPDASLQILGYIDFAVDIGASLLNVHLVADRGIEAYANAITPIIQRAREADIRLSIENTPFTSPEDFNSLFSLLLKKKGLTGEYVGMCMDLGHANLYKETRNDYLMFFDNLESLVPLNHIHMHENFGDSDSHLPMFTGPSSKDPSGLEEFIQRLMMRNYSGSIIFEQWPEPPSLLNQARENLLRMFRGSYKRRERRFPLEHPLAERLREPSDFLQIIVQADRKAPSWKDKLEWLRDTIMSESFNPNLENLVYLAIYLRFLGTGKIATSESGGHYRPSHHAKAARIIEERLRDFTSTENAFIVRKIYPWLPSYDKAFTRQEPLTRIRDIAHRNDIPKELKYEIKHTLQNKLHRCAGPEDLATSAALLERITAAGNEYPESFVNEFKVFHEELKEFFNARSLKEQLESILNKSDMPEAALIDEFLKAHEIAPGELERLCKTLNILTELRKGFQARLGSITGPFSQQLRLADIGLEDYAFVLLSSAIQIIDSENENVLEWENALGALSLTVANLYLNGTQERECTAIVNELDSLRQAFDASKSEHLLRLKASLERCLRFSDQYTDRILSLFPARVEKLGRQLGVSDEAIRFFCEGDIRGNLVFQLSKLASTLLKNIRALAALPPWDALVTGRVSGHVVSAVELGSIERPVNGKHIVILGSAEGDEDIPEGVAGIILCHALPHLSHLGVRARQHGTVFAVCEDREICDGLKVLEGKNAALEVFADEVRLTATEKAVVATESMREPVKLPKIDHMPTHRLLPLEQVMPSNGGSKAFAGKRLFELSAGEKPPLFYFPYSLVAPFGAMEESLRSSTELEHEFHFLLDLLEEASPESLGSTLQSLRALTGQLTVHDDILWGIKEGFLPGTRLMVRSSSNCEDLKNYSGAGIYESFANVSMEEVDDAILKVWASLWTEKAVLSRKKAGISHKSAHMAVLIQEMMAPDLSFFMHTINPITGKDDELYVELAVGLGETLAAGIARGNPYRMTCNKTTGHVRTLAFGSINNALMPEIGGGIANITVDYSKIPLTIDQNERETLINRLASIGIFVEKSFDCPQDIEGVIVGHDVYLVQSRPAQGVR